MHGYLFDDDAPALKRRILLDAERLTAPETDLLLTMNQWDYDFAVGRRLAGRVEKIPGMGVDFTKLDRVTDSREALRDKLGLPRAAFLLLYAAEFSNRKSQSVLIEAMTALPERALLLLAGDGGQLDACKAQARELGLGDRVRFLGHVADIAPLYRASDACVSASRSEGLPFNVMEAMRAGLPVVASRVKGHTDLIEDGVSGLLYEYGNARDCAEKLRQLMDAPALCQALSAAARARAGAYRLETVLPVVMDRYLSALDGGGH
jgi:glycosyltransferase EpsD